MAMVDDPSEGATAQVRNVSRGGSTVAPKVLYVVGWGRSGSTILDNLLGEIDGFFSAGELTYLWKRGLLRGRRCGCGVPVARCEVWSAVLERGFGYPASGDIDPSRVVEWQEATTQLRHTWRLLRARPDEPPRSPALRAYLGATRRLYVAIAEVTGARVVVDSSKRPPDAAGLRLMAEIPAYYLHLVRDPRAVAYSWERKKARSDSQGPAEMVTHGPVDSTLNWVAWNAAAESLRRRVAPERWMSLRYEDFIANPRDSLVAILNFVGADSSSLPFEDDHTARLGTNHTASGNPSRFASGLVKLRSDDEWITRQARLSRLVTTTLALPLLGRYRYPMRPSPQPRADSVPAR
jgi:hypothetical protein